MKTINAVDLFCGAGGESTGMSLAVKSLNYKIDLLAINHWDVAIETHSKNHPEARHMCESIQSIDPLKAIPGGRLDLLWASPECTHHSNARGGRPRSDQSRASAWLVLKWLSDLYVDRVIIENVPEFTSWGPLGADGRPMPSKKGETFQAFISALKSLGYRVDWRILCAADYGDPTTRRRMFLQAVRGKNRISWPEMSHSDTADLFNSSPWRPAREIIDWSIPGESIFSRKKPLAPATMARIEAGIQKFWGEWAEPFLILMWGTGKGQIPSTALSLDRPVPTLTAGGGHIGLVEPFLVRYNGGVNRFSRVEAPVGTLDTSNRYGLVEPFILASGHRSSIRVRDINEPLSTVVTKAEHCVVEPFLIKYYGSGDAQPVRVPLGTVTTKDRFGLVSARDCGLDITFRMLQPHELAAAQGFPRGYWFAGTKTDQVKQIGNAVPVNTAKALCESILRSA